MSYLFRSTDSFHLIGGSASVSINKPYHVSAYMIGLIGGRSPWGSNFRMSYLFRFRAKFDSSD